MAPIKVLLVDADVRIQDALSFFLDVTEDLQPIGRASNGEEALRLCKALQPDVVLMEIELPDTDAMKLVETICIQCPHTGIVVLTRSLAKRRDEALRAGANRYLTKSATIDAIADAIRAAARERAMGR
jgi:DNA-binding NarL/FixJ family response regulator